MKVTGRGCEVDLRADGKVEFNDDFTDIKSLSSGGSFHLDVMRDGTRHELTVTEQGGALKRTWKVDGKERPYDAEAQRWFAAFLIDLDRQTAIGVDTRLPALLKRGGVAAVLDETAQMAGDYARNVYYNKLATATRLSAADVTKMLDQATSLHASDYYAADLLEHVAAPQRRDPGVRAAGLRLVATMRSDYYIANGLTAVAGDGLDPASRQTWLDAISRLRSDYYKDEALAALLRARNLEEGDLLSVVGTAKTVSGEYYKANVLTAVAHHPAANARVKDAVIAASDGMSSYYRDSVRRAAGR